MRWVVFAVACTIATGCAQLLGIDEGVVGGGDHDEDGDGIDDSRDNCPADSNPTQAENEGAIGAFCDPRPEMGGDRIALFLSFFPAGQPAALEPRSTVAFGPDFAFLANDDLQTRSEYAATVASIDMSFGAFNPNAVLELSVGPRACQIATCDSRICIVAVDGSNTSSKMFTPTSVDVKLSLVQTPTQLGCVLTPGMVETIGTSGIIVSDRVRIRAISAMLTVKNLTIYDVD